MSNNIVVNTKYGILHLKVYPDSVDGCIHRTGLKYRGRDVSWIEFDAAINSNGLRFNKRSFYAYVPSLDDCYYISKKDREYFKSILKPMETEWLKLRLKSKVDQAKQLVKQEQKIISNHNEDLKSAQKMLKSLTTKLERI